MAPFAAAENPIAVAPIWPAAVVPAWALAPIAVVLLLANWMPFRILLAVSPAPALLPIATLFVPDATELGPTAVLRLLRA